MKAQVPFASLGFVATVLVFGSALGQASVSPPTGRSGSPPEMAAPPAFGATTPAYERKGRRDPFEPIQILQSDMTSPTIAAAKLKGILRGRTPRVLVETPDGLGYILAVGDMLAEGRLIEIRVDSAVFSVPLRAGSTTDRVVLRLSDD
jgi:hypothetical protein